MKHKSLPEHVVCSIQEVQGQEAELKYSRRQTPADDNQCWKVTAIGAWTSDRPRQGYGRATAPDKGMDERPPQTTRFFPLMGWATFFTLMMMATA